MAGVKTVWLHLCMCKVESAAREDSLADVIHPIGSRESSLSRPCNRSSIISQEVLDARTSALTCSVFYGPLGEQAL